MKMSHRLSNFTKLYVGVTIADRMEQKGQLPIAITNCQSINIDHILVKGHDTRFNDYNSFERKQ